MITQTYNLTNKGVTLTSYILDSSFDNRAGYKRPAVLICPGGAYAFCSNREAEPIAMHFLAMGYNTFDLFSESLKAQTGRLRFDDPSFRL